MGDWPSHVFEVDKRTSQAVDSATSRHSSFSFQTPPPRRAVAELQLKVDEVSAKLDRVLSVSSVQASGSSI